MEFILGGRQTDGSTDDKQNRIKYTAAHCYLNRYNKFSFKLVLLISYLKSWQPYVQDPPCSPDTYVTSRIVSEGLRQK